MLANLVVFYFVSAIFIKLVVFPRGIPAVGVEGYNFSNALEPTKKIWHGAG
jgi:hypothetical protein